MNSFYLFLKLFDDYTIIYKFSACNHIFVWLYMKTKSIWLNCALNADNVFNYNG